MIKLYLFSKTIHRVAMFALIVLTLLMGTTGLYLKYPWMEKVVPLDLSQLRYLHNQLSPIFTIFLAVMMVTGIIMYIFPLIKKK